MDYEFHILLHEKELAHLREMQELTRGRLAAHDRSIEALHATTGAIAEQLKEMAASHVQLQAELATLTLNVNTLVRVLLRDHPNGHE